MAQVTKAVVQGIIAGQGYTDNEVRQLAHHFLAALEQPAVTDEMVLAACQAVEPDLFRHGLPLLPGDGPSGRAQMVEVELNVRKVLAAALSAPRSQPAAVGPSSPSPTAGMNIAQRVLHVGGRNNAAGYIEFGSIQAVEALVRQVLRDQPDTQAQQTLPEIDYDALIRAAYASDKRWSQGTPGCVAFSRGAEWYRSQLGEKDA